MKKTLPAIALTLAVTVGVSTPAFASSGSSLSSSPGSSDSSMAPTPWAGEISEGLDVELVGDLLGPGISDHVGFLVGDLGIMTGIGTGEEFALIFGDSWRGPGFGENEWMSPVGVVAVMNDEGRIEILRPLNDGEQVEQLIDYEHVNGLTLIPSDIINIDGTLYLQGMWNRGIGNVLGTQIWASADQGASWAAVSTAPADYMDGMANLITWELGPDGYVYMMSSDFQRDDDVYLTRFLPEDIGDRSAWEHYSFTPDGTGTWGTDFDPVLSERVSAGEMSLRYIQGHWVLAMFNAERMSIEVRISEEIARDWNEITPADVVVGGHWGAPQTPANFAQLYGAYIVPGSTLDNMDLVVSQWNTTTDDRYNSTQFNVQGLDEFFGIGTDAPRARTMAPQDTYEGDQSVITVEQQPVDEPAPEQQEVERFVDHARDLTVVPLEN